MSSLPELIGGGCLMENNKIIVSGFMEPGYQLANISYSLDLTYPFDIPDNEQLDWDMVIPGNKLPGDIVIKRVDQLKLGFYVLGDIFKAVSKKIQRREEHNESSISDTSLFDEILRETPPDNPYSSPVPGNPPPQAPTKPISRKSLNQLAQAAYSQLLNDNLRTAINYKQYIIFLDNLFDPLNISSPINKITRYYPATDQTEIISTTGPIPLFRAGFSAGQFQNELFITGGQDPQFPHYAHQIFSLNLDNFEWTRFNPEGFKGAKSGCLYLTDSYLVHSFGILNNEFITTTQIINTRTWSKVKYYFPHPQFTSESPVFLYVTIIISCLLLLILFTLLFIWLRSRNRHISPPVILDSPVWAPVPLPTYHLDTTLITNDPDLFYDYKVPTSHTFSSSPSKSHSTLS